MEEGITSRWMSVACLLLMNIALQWFGDQYYQAFPGSITANGKLAVKPMVVKYGRHVRLMG